MGSIQSTISTTNLIAAALFVGIAASVWRNRPSGIPGNQGPPLVEKSAPAGKKGKKKKPAGGKQSDLADSVTLKSDDGAGGRSASPDLAASSMSEHTIPGGIFDSREDLMDSSVGPANPEKKKEKKKKKAKKTASQAAASHADERVEAAPVAGPSRVSTNTSARAPPARSEPQEETWTRVETKRKSSSQHNTTTSDAGITTTSMDEEGSLASLPEKSEDAGKSKPPPKTFAEKMLPKGRKTAVDDMLETPHYPEVSRVIRVTPAAHEKPAAGFSWADYEDVEDVPGADADGEDDGGWGIVKSRGRAKHPTASSPGGTPSTPSKASETLTKKQRQRAAKREAEKSAKAEGEAERLAALARHRRESEKAKIADLYKPGKPKMSGGMFATLDSDSKLIWE